MKDHIEQITCEGTVVNEEPSFKPKPGDSRVQDVHQYITFLEYKRNEKIPTADKLPQIHCFSFKLFFF